MIISDNLLDIQNGCYSVSSIMQNIDETKRQNLIKIIKRLNLKQRHLANMIDQDPRYLNRIIKGHRNLSDDMIEKICKALNLKYHIFFIEEDTPLPVTDLEKRALYLTREANKYGVADIIIKYGDFVLIEAKKTKEIPREGKGIRYKVGGG